MNTIIRKGLATAVAVSAGLMITLSTGPAFASADDLAEQTAVVMAQHPGGHVVAPGIVAWDQDTVILTLPGAESPEAIGTCATGSYCAWSETSYTGTKLSFSSCSVAGSAGSLSLLGGAVRSTANARSSGHVNAMNGSAVVYSMAANTGRPSNSTALTSLVCFT